jgi:hypothetical protein
MKIVSFATIIGPAFGAQQETTSYGKMCHYNYISGSSADTAGACSSLCQQQAGCAEFSFGGAWGCRYASNSEGCCPKGANEEKFCNAFSGVNAELCQGTTCQFSVLSESPKQSAKPMQGPQQGVDGPEKKCNPKECPDWTCKDWCKCFKAEPKIVEIFEGPNPSQWDLAVRDLCPADSDECDCTPFLHGNAKEDRLTRGANTKKYANTDGIRDPAGINEKLFGSISSTVAKQSMSAVSSASVNKRVSSASVNNRELLKSTMRQAITQHGNTGFVYDGGMENVQKLFDSTINVDQSIKNINVLAPANQVNQLVDLTSSESPYFYLPMEDSEVVYYKYGTDIVKVVRHKDDSFSLTMNGINVGGSHEVGEIAMVKTSVGQIYIFFG